MKRALVELPAALVSSYHPSDMSKPPFRAGVLIAGRYLLEQELGEGGMGTVWEATHTVTRRSVAMKFLKASLRHQEELRKRFLREASAASALHHPNVVEILDVFDFEERAPVLVMELLRGETLGKKLQRDERLSLEETATLVAPVVSAVAAAHALGIVHRDVKPENVFLSDTGKETIVKVLDFGIAKLVAQPHAEASALHTSAGAMLGTPGYMAPEQATGEVVDHRVDIWSLGVMLYECLSGSRPIDGENFAQIVARLLSAGIIPLERLVPELPHELTAAIMQMLSRDPSRRPANLGSILALLARYARAPSPSFGLPANQTERVSPVDPRGPTQASHPRASSPVLAELFGRTNELSRIGAALQRAEQGHGSLVLLSGEAGIGKSRLAKEVAKSAEARGVATAWGRCWEAGGAPAFWPWTQVFRTLGRDPFAGVDRSADASQRFALFDAATRDLADAARTKPILVLLDDLHVADAPSLLLLLFIARELGGMRVLVVGAARDTHAWTDPEIGVLIAKIQRESEALLLPRLTSEDVTAWTSSRSVLEADEVYRASEGNPLFVEELLRVGTSKTPTHGALAQVIDEHLSHLSPRARLVLEAASVLGREFTPDALSGAFGFQLDEVAEDAHEALAKGVLFSGEHSACVFSHTLLRDRLYDSLAPTRRAELHWQVGVANQGADATAAHHLLMGCKAGDAVVAAKVARDAARTMLAQLAYEEAAALAKRAQAVIPAHSALGCELELVRGEATIRADKADEGRAIAKSAAALATELDMPELIARAALVYGTDTMTGGVDNTMVELLHAALQRLPPEPSALRVRVLGRLAMALSPPRDAAGAARIVDMTRASLSMARELGDKETLLYALTFAHFALAFMVDFEERAAIVSEAVLLARELGQHIALERTSGMHIGFLVQQGRRAEANVELHAFEEMMEQPGRTHRWGLLGVQSVLALLDGRLDDATRLSDESRTLARPGTPAEMSWALQRIAIAQASGDAASVAPNEDELLRFFAPRRGFMPWPSAWLFAALGKRAEAIAIIESLLRVEQGFPALIVTGSACVLIKDSALAARAYTALEREPIHHQVFWGPGAASVFGPTSRVLGDLALLLGRTEQASAHYDDAIALCRTMGAKPLLELSLRGREACGPRMSAPEPEPKHPRLSLRREGDMWAIEAGGAPFRLKHSKGLAYLEQLVSQSGREVHVLMLVGAEHGDADAGAILDARAKAQYQRRIELLDDRIELARSLGDEQGVAKARGELDAVAAELAAAVGLGGRDRRVSSNVERARINVQRRLKDSIGSISAVDAGLGRFLQATVKTGTFCSFQPL